MMDPNVEQMGIGSIIEVKETPHSNDLVIKAGSVSRVIDLES